MTGLVIAALGVGSSSLIGIIIIFIQGGNVLSGFKKEIIDEIEKVDNAKVDETAFKEYKAGHVQVHETYTKDITEVKDGILWLTRERNNGSEKQ